MKKQIIISALILVSSISFNAQSKLAINAGIALPMSDFGDAYSTGFGGVLTFLYEASKSFDLGVNAGYITWSGKDAFDGSTYSTLPILACFKYYLTSENVRPYFNGELGLHLINAEQKVKGPGFSLTTTTDMAPYFGFGAGLGVLIPSGESFIDLAAKYNSISYEDSSSDYISVMVGFVFKL